MTTGGPRRRIVLHDYAGYAFPFQLGRWLAAQGHEVLFLHSLDIEAPQGRLGRVAEDPPGFACEGLSIGRPLAKYQFARRWIQETEYGARLGRRVAAFRPDVVLSTNTPPAVQSRLLAATTRIGVPMVAWVQDIFSLGAEEMLKSKPRPLRWAALRFLEAVEFGTIARSAAAVVISDDFLRVLADKGVHHRLAPVIENWAPQDDIVRQDKDNAWAREQGLADAFVFLYAGTLGMKHDPEHLAALARGFRDDPDVRVVLVSQGPGRAHLERVKAAEGLDNLILLDYQPFDRLSEVLSTADVSLVVLEPYAGALSVPSKVYSYFCVERPILAAIPATNLAARIIDREKAGLCVAPGDMEGFLAAAHRLRADAALRASMAANQRPYAATAFDIDRIGARFLSVIEECRAAAPRPQSRAAAFAAAVRRKLRKVAHQVRTPRYRRALAHGVAAVDEHAPLLAGLDAATVVDVGANKGQFALLALELFPRAMVHAFEPLPGPRRRLAAWSAGESRLVRYGQALSDSDGAAVMHVSAREDSSSLRAITDRQVAIFPGTHRVRGERVEVARMDSVLRPGDLVEPALLKIDVQGSELEVLRGAGDLLPRFEWVYAECSFAELYAGQALADEVATFLEEAGFAAVAYWNVVRGDDGRPVQADVLFQRRSPRPQLNAAGAERRLAAAG